MVQPKEMAKRIRAARHYGGLSRVGLGDYLGISSESIKRMELGTLPREIRPSELLMIAHATGVPLWFLVEGWPATPLADEKAADLVEGLARELRARHRVADTAPDDDRRGSRDS